MALTITWFPPSWVQIQTRSRRISIDPAYMKTYYRNFPKKIEFSSWPDPIDGLQDELVPADLILVTHHHKDHCKRVTLDRLRQADTVVLASKRCQKELGTAMRTVQAGEKVSFDTLQITAVPAYNTEEGRSNRKQHRKGEGVGYLVTIEGRNIYHAGDTDFIPEMWELGPLDVALLPIGGTYTMDSAEAVRAARVLRARYVVPIHRFKADPFDFAEKIEKNQTSWEFLWISESHCIWKREEAKQ